MRFAVKHLNISSHKCFKRYVAFDVETTGLSPAHGHRVIEIGAVAIERCEIVDEFDTLIDAGILIPHDVQKIHRITNSMLQGKPRPEDVIPRFNEFIEDSTLLAHNAAFDLRFLRHEFERLNMRLYHRYFCTLEMSRRRHPRLPNHKLETIYRHLCGNTIGSRRRHRALDDARMVAAIWLAMEGK